MLNQQFQEPFVAVVVRWEIVTSFIFEANGFLFSFLTVTSTFPLFKWSLSHIPHPINVGVTEKGGRLLMDEL